MYFYACWQNASVFPAIIDAVCIMACICRLNTQLQKIELYCTTNIFCVTDGLEADSSGCVPAAGQYIAVFFSDRHGRAAIRDDLSPAVLSTARSLCPDEAWISCVGVHHLVCAD